MSDLSLSDLRREYFGGGSDAEYETLRAYYDDGITAIDVIGAVDTLAVITAAAPEDFNTLVEIAEGKVSSAGEYAAAGTDVLTAKVVADVGSRFVINANGDLEWGGGAGATDTGTRRLNAGTVLISERLVINTTDLTVGNGAADTVHVGTYGPAGQSGIALQNGEAGSKLYRKLAGTIAANDTLVANSSLASFHGAAGQVTIGDGTIYFGSAADTNLLRGAANTLKTDDSFHTAIGIGVGTGISGVPSTNGRIYAGEKIYARENQASQVTLGDLGPVSESGILFGSGGDARIYRVGAGYFAFTNGTSNGFSLGVGSGAGGTDVGGTIRYGTGAPNNANGTNGDIYFRVDGGALTTIYQRRAGAWVGII